MRESEKPVVAARSGWVFANRKKGDYPNRTPDSGKWLIFVRPEATADVWTRIKAATEQGRLGYRAMLSEPKQDGSRVICVCTYDETDVDDVRRVRQELRELGFDKKLAYKADADSHAGVYRASGHKKISRYYE